MYGFFAAVPAAMGVSVLHITVRWTSQYARWPSAAASRYDSRYHSNHTFGKLSAALDDRSVSRPGHSMTVLYLVSEKRRRGLLYLPCTHSVLTAEPILQLWEATSRFRPASRSQEEVDAEPAQEVPKRLGHAGLICSCRSFSWIFNNPKLTSCDRHAGFI